MSKKNEFTGLEVEQGSFALKKVAINNKDYCSVQFMIARVSSENSIVINGSLSPQYACNEALVNAIGSLQTSLCEITHKKIDKYHHVNVSSVELSGSEEKRNFKITGTDQSESKQSMKVETPKIMFSMDDEGNEGKVRAICDEIEILVFRYLFAGDQAQRSLPLDQDGEPEVAPKHEPAPKESKPKIEEAEIID